MIERYYGEACTHLSTRTVHHTHRVLSKCLKHAVRQGYLGRNPASWWMHITKRKQDEIHESGRSRIPVRHRHAASTLPCDIHCRVHGDASAELLGLRWRDVTSNDAPYLSARFCTSGEGSAPSRAEDRPRRRKVSMSPKLALYLKGYRAQCQAYHLAVEKPLTKMTWCSPPYKANQWTRQGYPMNSTRW